MVFHMPFSLWNDIMVGSSSSILAHNKKLLAVEDTTYRYIPQFDLHRDHTRPKAKQNVHVNHTRWDITCQSIFSGHEFLLFIPHVMSPINTVEYCIPTVVHTALICLGSNKNKGCASTRMWIYRATSYCKMRPGLHKGMHSRLEMCISLQGYSIRVVSHTPILDWLCYWSAIW